MVSRRHAGPTRKSRRLMSLTDKHTSDVEHGSTRQVYDGSTVCVQADVHSAVGRHATLPVRGMM